MKFHRFPQLVGLRLFSAKFHISKVEQLKKRGDIDSYIEEYHTQCEPKPKYHHQVIKV